MTSKKHYGKQTGRPVTHALPTPAGGVRLETFVPWTLVRRGLKKRVITPLDAPQEFLSEVARERKEKTAKQDTALMRALGLAHHWQRLLDEERVADVAEIAKAEGLMPTTVGRLLRLARLAPDIIEQLMQGCQPRRLTLLWLMRNDIPALWPEQRQTLERFR